MVPKTITEQVVRQNPPTPVVTHQEVTTYTCDPITADVEVPHSENIRMAACTLRLAEQAEAAADNAQRAAD